MTVGAAIEEAYAIHGIGDRTDRPKRVAEMLDLVRLPRAAAKRYPHEFSGGQRQRIGIARALALRPSFVVCDEAVSALDVSIQSQILNLLMELIGRLGLSYIFISHDLSVVEHVSDRVAVMYLGRIVEIADKHELFANPRHPYTQALLASVPIADPKAKRTAPLIDGDVPSPINPPSGCAFHTRCRYAMDRCKTERPVLQAAGPAHQVACWLNEGTGQAAS
jgi:peptide/nickel transport system ATP-binding protein/oligopeptide transport system ATP-binding protein